MTPIPLAHTTDPSSSHEAVERHTKSGRRVTNCERVYGVVKRYPGWTAKELSYFGIAHRIDAHELRRRLTDLKNQGRIERGEQRTCRIAGTKACTWYAVSLF